MKKQNNNEIIEQLTNQEIVYLDKIIRERQNIYVSIEINRDREDLIENIKKYQLSFQRAKKVTLISYAQIGTFLMYLKNDFTHKDKKLKSDDFINYLSGYEINFNKSYINKLIRFAIIYEKWRDIVYCDLTFKKTTEHFKEIENIIENDPLLNQNLISQNKSPKRDPSKM